MQRFTIRALAITGCAVITLLLSPPVARAQEKLDKNAQFCEDFDQEVIIGGKLDLAPKYLTADFKEHNVRLTASGLNDFVAKMTAMRAAQAARAGGAGRQGGGRQGGGGTPQAARTISRTTTWWCSCDRFPTATTPTILARRFPGARTSMSTNWSVARLQSTGTDSVHARTFLRSFSEGASMTLRLTASAIVAGLLVLLPATSRAQSPASDEVAIRARLAAYADARNRRDAHAEALCYTLDGDFRSSAGPFVSGREAVEKQLTVTNPDYRFLLTVTHFRFITPQIAIVDADVNTGIGTNLAPLVGVYVMQKQGNDWLISGARIARAPAPAAAPAR